MKTYLVKIVGLAGTLEIQGDHLRVTESCYGIYKIDDKGDSVLTAAFTREQTVGIFDKGASSK